MVREITDLGPFCVSFSCLIDTFLPCLSKVHFHLIIVNLCNDLSNVNQVLNYPEIYVECQSNVYFVLLIFIHLVFSVINILLVISFINFTTTFGDSVENKYYKIWKGLEFLCKCIKNKSFGF